jgi:hypothetical protein
MKIQFIKSATGIGYGYLEGAEVDCLDAFGKEMIDLGYAKMMTTNPDALPLDLPGRDALLKAGIKTIDEIKAIGDLTEIEGIGKATAEKIGVYINPEK